MSKKAVVSSLMSESQLGRCPACRTENVRIVESGGIFVCEKCSVKKFSAAVRKSLRESYERQQENKRRKAWRVRIDIARKGVRYFEQGNVTEALKNFREYMSILELKHGVEPDGLHPNFFSDKEGAAEMLLITGVYWDMAKIHDHIKGHKLQTRQCINKFLEFSIDRPHVILSSEAIRRYLKSGQCVNVDDFKNAHNLVRQHLTKCFLATAVYGPTSQEVLILRNFRDQVLLKSSFGKWATKVYYFISRPIAILLLKAPVAARAVHFLLKPIVSFAAKVNKII
ncbi:MAG: CFI-box-CTERM domain-containing protein [Bacteriovoracia bacterium]